MTALRRIVVLWCLCAVWLVVKGSCDGHHPHAAHDGIERGHHDHHSHSHDDHHSHSHDEEHHHHDHGDTDSTPHTGGEPLFVHNHISNGSDRITSAALHAAIGSMMTSVVPISVIPFAHALTQHHRGTTLRWMTIFAAGALLSDVFLHMMPGIVSSCLPGQGGDEAHHHHDHEHDHNHQHEHGHHVHLADTTPILLFLGSFLVCFLFESFAKLRRGDATASSCSSHKRSHESSHRPASAPRSRASNSSPASVTRSTLVTSSAAYIGLVGDFLHNVADGLALGVAAVVGDRSATLRRVTALMAHEFPHELGDFAMLTSCGWSLRSILWSQVVTALGNLCGCLLPVAAYALAVNQQVEGTLAVATGILEPIIAGSFLYMSCISLMGGLATSDVQDASAAVVVIGDAVGFFLGVCSICAVSYVES